MTFSNLGVVALPARLASHVTGVEMAFSPRPEAPYSCAAVTLADEPRLTHARGVRERRLEPRLERVLAAEGLAFLRGLLDKLPGAMGEIFGQRRKADLKEEGSKICSRDTGS